MSDIIDINVNKTVEEVTINVVDNVIQVNINQVNGGGGSQTLNETLVNGNATDGEDIFLSDGDSISLDNGSKLKKGTTNAGNGGNNGIALKCSLDYEFKWEAGRMYIMQQDGVGIRETRYNFNVAPTVNDDDTKGYGVDSRWILDNGDLYICTDATEANAVWQLQSNIPTLQEILDNNNSLVDNNNFQGSGSGSGNSGINNNGFGFAALFNNSGNDVNAFGYYSGTSNTFSGVNLFGKFAYADADNQIVMAKYDDVIRLRLSYINLTEDRKIEVPDASGTVALTSDIPTNTSDLVNNGENGTSPYVTADQLPSNLNLFATDVSSDIPTYFKLVTSISDPDFNVTPVNIPTGTITTTGQFIAALATTANVLVGNPGIINLLTIGNVRRTSGSGTAEFYYEVYHRTSGGTETLIATSSKTPPINTNVYTEFLAAALLNNGVFLATDRIVVKYYADRVGSGSNPNYDFQFGGISPVRTNFPVPATNIPLDAIPTDGSTNGVQSNGVFDALQTKTQLIGSISTLSTITGTTTETIVGSIEVLANTFKTINFLEIYALSSKSNTADASTITIYLNNTNNLSGSPLQLATYGATSTRITNMFRKATLFSNVLDMNSSRTSSLVTNIVASTPATGDTDSSVAYDVSTTKYIIFTITNSNSALTTKFKSAQITANII
jgi:hypothetical protein